MLGGHFRSLVLLLVAISIGHNEGYAEETDNIIQLQDVIIDLPESWTLKQKAKDHETAVIGLQSENGIYITLSVTRDDGTTLEDIFGFKGTIRTPSDFPLPIQLISNQFFLESQKTHTYGIFLLHRGFRYVGYANGTKANDIQKAIYTLGTFIREGDR